MNADAAITGFTFAGALWTENGTFRIKLTDGTRPGSYVTDRDISLRQLVGDGYTVIDGQTSGEDGVSASGASGSASPAA